MHTILIITVVTVISAAADKDAINNGDVHRSATTITNVTHADVNLSGAHPKDHDGNQKKRINQRKDVLPIIVFPDQLPYYTAVTEKGELLNRYDNAKKGATMAKNVTTLTTVNIKKSDSLDDKLNITSGHATTKHDAQSQGSVNTNRKDVETTGTTSGDVPKVSVKSSEAIPEGDGVGDRTSLTGDACPQGMAKLGNVCVTKD